jgi:drug/metabolite transporter (DMT)-like permease
MPATLVPYAGQLAALGTALLWAFTSLFFTAAARRLGAVRVNTFRILVAIALLGVTHYLLQGVWIPHALPGQVAYLAASGLVGLAIGDQALFLAFVYIGPRLSTLIMTTAPVIAAVFGWSVLGESLSPRACVGIAVTVAGVAWVVLERPARGVQDAHPHYGRGVFLAFIGAACQAGGLLLSKQGMGHGWLDPREHLDPQAATLVRMFFAGVFMTPVLAVHQILRRRALRRMEHIPQAESRGVRVAGGLLLAVCGAICGPFLGVWLSLVAADRAPVGIAQTLMSLTPIFILPLVVVAFRERVTLRAVLGAIVAVGGCVLLFVEPVAS